MPEVSQQSSWLNDVAKANMLYIMVTETISHVSTSWLNAEAKANIEYMSVTALVSHEPMG